MKTFNVLIEDNGKFKHYDIMPYLRNSWEDFLKRLETVQKEGWDSEYYKMPSNFEEFKEWVTETIKYRYWSRCEYEMLLVPWPPYTNENKEGTLQGSYKIDIYEQCIMNIDIIVNLFMEEIL